MEFVRMNYFSENNKLIIISSTFVENYIHNGV